MGIIKIRFVRKVVKKIWRDGTTINQPEVKTGIKLMAREGQKLLKDA